MKFYKLFIILMITCLLLLLACLFARDVEKDEPEEKIGKLIYKGNYLDESSDFSCQIAISADGNNLYAVDPASGSVITCLSRDVNKSGELTFIERHTLGTAAYVKVSPDGKNIYVGVASGSIYYYTRNNVTGTIEYVDFDIVTTPTDVTVSPDNKNVYVVSGNLDSLSWYYYTTSSKVHELFYREIKSYSLSLI